MSSGEGQVLAGFPELPTDLYSFLLAFGAKVGFVKNKNKNIFGVYF